MGRRETTRTTKRARRSAAVRVVLALVTLTPVTCTGIERAPEQLAPARPAAVLATVVDKPQREAVEWDRSRRLAASG